MFVLLKLIITIMGKILKIKNFHNPCSGICIKPDDDASSRSFSFTVSLSFFPLNQFLYLIAFTPPSLLPCSGGRITIYPFSKSPRPICLPVASLPAPSPSSSSSAFILLWDDNHLAFQHRTALSNDGYQ